MLKVGDRVHLVGRPETSGTIVQINPTNLWGVDFDEYLVEYDDDNLIPRKEWHTDGVLVPVEDLPMGIEYVGPVCECGAEKVMGKNARHSSWCALYKSQ